ncbi:MAG: hypothetical protein WA902_08295 [Thermosynechococcaceae cyanobacterium]
MVIKDIIQQAQHLSLQEQVSLMRQLTQLIEDNIKRSAPTTGTKEAPQEIEASSLSPKTDFRELSGFLYRSQQPSISVEEMDTAIAAEANRLL